MELTKDTDGDPIPSIFGLLSAGASSSIQWTEANTVDDLNGPGLSGGFSGGYLWYSWGGDFICAGDEMRVENPKVNGLESGSGVGAGLDAHMMTTKTITHWKANLFD